ncbi:MAG: EamA family transporter RarD [Myxococcales bacterium]|nr:EamA family transporter RarD [Myxococcales bacterium]
MVAGALLSLNWVMFLWAVTHGHIVEVSLGYYINPLMSVALGVVVMGERLSPRVQIAIAIAAIGVVVMTFAAGQPPWISLWLAVTFALYGLLKKQADAAEPLEGLVIETGTAAIPLALWLAILIADGQSQVVAGSVNWAWLPFTGVITVVPLLLFGISTQLIPLSMVGMLQYLAPSIQLALGLMLYGEAVTPAQIFGFIAIWLALGIYVFDNLRAVRTTETAA